MSDHDRRARLAARVAQLAPLRWDDGVTVDRWQRLRSLAAVVVEDNGWRVEAPGAA